jgi:hexosaminidase
MKHCLLIICLFCTLSSFSQDSPIIPQPAELKMGQGSFIVTNKTSIVTKGSDLDKSAKFLQAYLKKMYGLVLPIVTSGSNNGNIIISYAKPEINNNIATTSKNSSNPIPGAYTLTISGNQVIIEGENEAGAFYGVQSLIQLFPFAKTNSLSIPQLWVKDHPRFAYRGMHLDVARHFFPVEFLKKYIDFIAMHKMNTFHWHLTEDQGWRIEIKKYPKLTSIGAYRNGTTIGRYPGTGNTNTRYGGYYTQAQIKELVKYASDRYVEVIPEIELPGHSSAAIAAYPELSCFPDSSTKVPAKIAWNGSTKGKQVQQTWGVFEDVFAPTETTFKFLENVFDEVIQLFPSKYIHIGGDECPKEAWKKSAFCQQLIKEKGLKDEHGLQSYFIQRVEKYLNSKGKQIIGWDEILEGGLAPNATVMSWRGEEGGIEAAKQKHNVIMTPGGWMYFDHKQSKNEDSVTIGGYTTIQKVYSYDPIPKALSAEDAKYVLGAQANVWTEYMTNTQKVEYQIFPRMSALSEVLWTPKEKKSWSNFEKRLINQFKRYDWLGINYSKAYFDPVNNSTEPTKKP